MKLTRTDLEAAAFWEELSLCLDCEELVRAENGTFCPNCSCSPVIPAERVLKVLDLFEPDEEGA